MPNNHRNLVLLLFFLFSMTGCLFEKGSSENIINNDSEQAEVPPPAPILPTLSILCDKQQLSENSANLVNNFTSQVSCSVALSTMAKSDITVSLEIFGTATPGVDYLTLPSQITIPNGSLQSSFTVTAIDDSIYEPIEKIEIHIMPDSSVEPKYDTKTNLNSVTLSVLDDDLFSVSAYISANDTELSEAEPNQTLTWTIEFYDDVTGDPVSLPFDVQLKPVAEGNRINIAQRLTSDIQNVIVPKDSSTYSFSFGIVNDQIPQPIQSDSIKFVSDLSLFSENSYLSQFLILYDDELPAISLVAVSTSSTENGGTTTFKAVSNTILPSSITLPLTYSGNALRGIDYRGGNGSDVANSITIPAGAKESSTTNIVLIGDGYYEGSEYLNVAISSNPATYSLTNSSFSISITDDVTPTPEKRSIELTATPQTNPNSILLDWTGDGPGASYKVYRKLISDLTFPNLELASVAASTYSYTDTTVSPRVKYEYKVERAGGIAVGYIATGIDLTLEHDQGGILLVVESAIGTTLAAEINQWTQDLADDGFTVKKISVSTSDSVTQIKNRINQEVSDSLGTIKTVALFGHIPVPYSGNLAPDGHTDHIGAWPADGYFADLDTQNKWTDTSVNTTSASRTQNRNVPGDGKFDQSTLPLNLKVQIGRIDLANLPAFSPLNEVDLLRRYLNKNHKFRKKIVSVSNRALFDDNWGSYGGGDFFGTSMWRSISALMPKTNIVANDNSNLSDWFTQLRTNDYLFAYGGGAGNYTSVSGVGATSDFASGASMAVFTALFGSYFGDWDSSNNVLRAPLAADGLGLTSVWSGRPEWYFHQMAVGESVGYSAMASMNNSTTYAYNIYGRGVHMALMGDPSLKAYVVAPAGQITSQINSNTLILDWTASIDSGVDGYYVYKSSNRSGPFTLLNTNPINGLRFETTAETGTIYYMVRATKLQTTPSGGFRNLSSGSTITVSF